MVPILAKFSVHEDKNTFVIFSFESEGTLYPTAKLAPPRWPPAPRSHPRHKQSLVQYLFPRLRSRYNERLIGFHLDTLPYYKHRIQSRIYRFVLERQRHRREQSRLVDRARRLLLGPPAPPISKNGPGPASAKMTSMPGYGVGSGNYGAGGVREPGARRKRFAAMAGSVYRAGATAVNEIKESYNQTRSGQIDAAETSKITIPGSFPDVAIVTKGNEQMVLFPSYAKRHVRGQAREFEAPAGPPHASTMNMSDHEYWQQEWSRHEDEKAIIDVDIRGWIYNPQRGPITRRNRMMIGLARQLSGIPAPNTQQGDQTSTAEASFSSTHQQHEEEREQQSIAQRAKEIEEKGEAEEEAAQRGSYSEPAYGGQEGTAGGRGSRGMLPPSAPSSPKLPPARANTAGGTQLSETDLVIANANLMARIAPFMTTPLVQVPITLFFYNDVQSQSRTVMTNDSGHFITRAALDFVPTHVRVLANEDISCTEPIQIIEPKGISLISDIDDTIKHSNILMGAKEIFRNTFIRDLNDMAVGGVTDWYSSLYDMGVKIHYCSNSPWQLYPVLATFLKRANLPPGSLHLKQYSGMLQGIFEPVAERKKGTLEKIMRDFPERKFLLVGDSGEADLEVYTELAIANPGRIVALFIRDVTTPEQRGYFDSGFNAQEPTPQRKQTYRSEREQKPSSTGEPAKRPALPPRLSQKDVNASGSLMGDLIDLSEEPEIDPSRRPSEATQSHTTNPMSQSGDSLSRKPPPRPSKPTSLRSSPAVPVLTTEEPGELTERKKPPPPPAARKPTPSPSSRSSRSSTPSSSSQQQQLTSMRSESSLPTVARNGPRTTTTFAPPPPPPRRRGTPSSVRSASPRLTAANANRRRTNPDPTDSSADLDLDPLTLGGAATASSPSAGVGGRQQQQQQQQQQQGTTMGSGPVDRRLDLWRRRLERAHDTLDQRGIKLYTWRRGDEVVAEAVGIVREELRAMGVRPEVSRKG
ncbi:hypothetical protein SLS62_010217 [Diatrype stigma]|uniref:Phosphatidate phosphatase APP1 catalytic domain-containing protein n=1 Tax=Diatrype stigma TaxID=117547 RepID=A0AAN9YGX0_9PEZI